MRFAMQTLCLTDLDREIVQAFADNDMNVARTAEAVYMHRNSVNYHLDKVKRLTGLNPCKFYDLVKLVTEKEGEVNE